MGGVGWGEVNVNVYAKDISIWFTTYKNSQSNKQQKKMKNLWIKAGWLARLLTHTKKNKNSHTHTRAGKATRACGHAVFGMDTGVAPYPLPLAPARLSHWPTIQKQQDGCVKGLWLFFSVRKGSSRVPVA